MVAVTTIYSDDSKWIKSVNYVFLCLCDTSVGDFDLVRLSNPHSESRHHCILHNMKGRWPWWSVSNKSAAKDLIEKFLDRCSSTWSVLASQRSFQISKTNPLFFKLILSGNFVGDVNSKNPRITCWHKQLVIWYVLQTAWSSAPGILYNYETRCLESIKGTGDRIPLHKKTRSKCR